MALSHPFPLILKGQILLMSIFREWEEVLKTILCVSLRSRSLISVQRVAEFLFKKKKLIANKPFLPSNYLVCISGQNADKHQASIMKRTFKVPDVKTIKQQSQFWREPCILQKAVYKPKAKVRFARDGISR